MNKIDFDGDVVNSFPKREANGGCSVYMGKKVKIERVSPANTHDKDTIKKIQRSISN